MQRHFSLPAFGLLLFTLLFLAPPSAKAQRGIDGANGGVATGETSRVRLKGGIVTLYALDPLASSLCFDDGADGRVFQQGEVRNRCSHLDFNQYYNGAFTVGIQGGDQGVIYDIGTATDLQQVYGYEETVGKGSGFASLQRKNDKILILKDRKAGTLQEVKESLVLFQQPLSNVSPTSQYADIKPGHIYLARITNKRNPESQILVKLLVLAFTANESVTLRWELL